MMRLIRFAAAALLALALRPACARAEDGQPPPVALVSRFLELSNEQTQRLIAIMQEREKAVRPIALAVQATRETLEAALAAPEPDAATVGRLILAIRSGERQASAAAQGAAAAFEATLTPEQGERLEFVRQAARVAPALPAFAATGLL